MIELNKIHQGDCLEVMKLIDDKSIDMILCDLPYGTTNCKWDTIIPLDKLWEQYERIIKDNGAIVLTAQTPFDKVLGCSNLKLLRYEWIWEKTMATGGMNANKMPLKASENILVFYKKLPTYNPIKTSGKPYVKKRDKEKIKGVYKNNGLQKTFLKINNGERYPRNIIKISNPNHKSLHPTQKPLALFEYLIKTYTNEGDLVLDNCMGSGTTAIASIKTNRNFIGIELEKEYVNIASQRIKKQKEDGFPPTN